MYEDGDEDNWEPWDKGLVLSMIAEYKGNNRLRMLTKDKYSSSDSDDS